MAVAAQARIGPRRIRRLLRLAPPSRYTTLRRLVQLTSFHLKPLINATHSMRLNAAVATAAAFAFAGLSFRTPTSRFATRASSSPTWRMIIRRSRSFFVSIAGARILAFASSAWALAAASTARWMASDSVRVCLAANPFSASARCAGDSASTLLGSTMSTTTRLAELSQLGGECGAQQ